MLAFRRREISPFPSLLRLDEKEGDPLTYLIDDNYAFPLPHLLPLNQYSIISVKSEL